MSGRRSGEMRPAAEAGLLRVRDEAGRRVDAGQAVQ